jgi:hypothetical protein
VDPVATITRISEHRKKRPTKKEHNRFRPPETNAVSGRIGWRNKKWILANMWLPPNGFSV